MKDKRLNSFDYEKRRDESNKSFILYLLSLILIDDSNKSFILYPLSFILYL